ncbi:hypothetical protein [Microvirga thermotolerans]|uniref:Uncharacterized protein n=1 Tax=Microvirga thermotolerans TaxID=2651334 RepID=A0A5P9JXB0_9HYPH|nr:hypothetical protein [Microvirga thermotolerans]QFU17237.1 hypothetical protein GDR74_13965 [Microvirga thermotolerans]
MHATRRTHTYHVASRAPRLDPRQQSRFSLALVMLMGLATLSVLATTTQALSDHRSTVGAAFALR